MLSAWEEDRVDGGGQRQAGAVSRAVGSVSLLEPGFLLKGKICSYNHSLPPASFLAGGLSVLL